MSSVCATCLRAAPPFSRSSPPCCRLPRRATVVLSSSSSIASCLVRCRATRLRTRMHPRPAPLAQGQALREAEAAAVAVSPLRCAESAAMPRRAAPAKELIPRAMAALVKSSGPGRHYHPLALAPEPPSSLDAEHRFRRVCTETGMDSKGMPCIPENPKDLHRTSPVRLHGGSGPTGLC
jgi:hypothetical protein